GWHRAGTSMLWPARCIGSSGAWRGAMHRVVKMARSPILIQEGIEVAKPNPTRNNED
ncbi:hypothetical protein HAX54_023562, partial [Datura stramonium]|nr:hypothetical protein [Datura stramonium]